MNKRHFAQRFACGMVVAAALTTYVMAYAQQSASTAVRGGVPIPLSQAPDMVEVCRGACTVVAVSNPSAKFQFAETRWSSLVDSRLPLDVNCGQACTELGDSSGSGLPKILYAQKEREPYTVTWVDAANKVTESKIPALPAGTNGVIAGRITLPDGAPAARIRVDVTAVPDLKGVSGKWVVPDVANGSWEIHLLVNGAVLTGKVGQTVDKRFQSQPISDGYVDGDTVSFKATHDRRRITFTGTIQGTAMTLKRDVEVLPGARTGRAGIFGARGAKAFVAIRENGFESQVMTDSAGEYRLDRLPPGRYRVSAGSQEAVTYFPGVRSAADAGLITVSSNEVYAERDFTLRSFPAGRFEPFR